MNRTTRLIPALLVFALVLAACGTEDGTGGTTTTRPTSTTTTQPVLTTTTKPSIDHPRGSDQEVIRIAVGGGFVPVEWNLRELPVFVLYGDGTLLRPAPVPEIYPGPAILSMERFQVSEAGMQMLLDAAVDAGLLGEDIHLRLDTVADAATTTISITADGRTVTVSAYALEMEGENEPLRREMRSFMEDAVFDLESFLGDELTATGELYVPTTLVAYALEPVTGSDITPNVIEWPLGTFEFEQSMNFPCQVIEGKDVASLLPLLDSEATELTTWTDGVTKWRLVFRPMLPDDDPATFCGFDTPGEDV